MSFKLKTENEVYDTTEKENPETAALLLSTQGLTNALITETLVAKEGTTKIAYQTMAKAGLSEFKLMNSKILNILIPVPKIILQVI